MAIQNLQPLSGMPAEFPSDQWTLHAGSISTGDPKNPDSFREYEEFIARPAEPVLTALNVDAAEFPAWRVHVLTPEAHWFTAAGIVGGTFIAAHREMKVAVLVLLKEL